MPDASERGAAAYQVGLLRTRLAALSAIESRVRPVCLKTLGPASSRPDAALDLIRPLRSGFNGVSEGFPRNRVKMTVPNADRAIIAADKLTAYLLNMSHKRGAAKARLLISLGYRSDAPHVLESDLRAQHLSLEVNGTHENAYGVVYEIVGPIGTPNGSRV